jgi:peroxiredoxin
MVPRRSVGPGDRAPAFSLPTVNREGTVALTDYHDRPLLLGLYRGLHCPFCRRHLAQLDLTREKLTALGVETLAVVNTPVSAARLYFKYRPTRVLLASDPESATHRSYKLAMPAIVESAPGRDAWPTEIRLEDWQSERINPTGDLPEALPPFDALAALNARDGYELTDADQQVIARVGTQLVGNFLIDADGVVRWTFREEDAGPGGVGRFPREDDILAAARAVVG